MSEMQDRIERILKKAPMVHRIAANVASGCEVAAMPLRAITGERPGNWKSRLMSGPDCEDLRDRVVDALDREVALRGTQRHGKAADHVNERHDHQEEEGAGRRLRHKQELD